MDIPNDNLAKSHAIRPGHGFERENSSKKPNLYYLLRLYYYWSLRCSFVLSSHKTTPEGPIISKPK